jgi:hypothetical protein
VQTFASQILWLDGLDDRIVCPGAVSTIFRWHKQFDAESFHGFIISHNSTFSTIQSLRVVERMEFHKNTLLKWYFIL